ncbi:MAG: 30S ribosomal protein S20 [bacterium]
MPNKANAKKALRQSKKRAVLNKARKETYKVAIKKVLKTESKDEKKLLAVDAQKALDKAVKVGVLKKNTASRKLSRLMKRVNSK